MKLKINEQIGFREMVEYFHRNDHGFLLREVVDDLVWKLEAYYTDYIGSHKIIVVFNTDVFSPRKKVNALEFQNLIKMLVEQYNYVKKNLQPRTSTRICE